MNIRGILLASALTLIGTAGGFAGGYYLSKRKYLALADKEIDSVRKTYEKHFKSSNNKESKLITEKTPKPSTSHVLIKEQTPASEPKDYSKLYSGDNPPKEIESVSSIGSPSPRKEPKQDDAIRILTPEEFQESQLPCETLYWFSDKVLTDQDYNIIHNTVELIGPEALNTFGRYSDDTVYVRNKNQKVDYEIVWDSRKYESVIRKRGDHIPLEEDE